MTAPDVRDVAWYLAYPARDLAGASRSITAGWHIARADVRVVPHIDDAYRVGLTICAAMCAAAVALLTGSAAAAVAVLAVAYVASRPSRVAWERRRTIRRLEDHAAFIIGPPAPGIVVIHDDQWNDAGRLVAFTLHYPTEWQDSKPYNRQALTDHLAGKVPGRDVWRQQWNTDDDYVTWQASNTDLPDVVPLELHDGLPWHLLPLGRGPGGDRFDIDLRRTPHVMVVATTGGGKTTVLRSLVAAAVHAGHLDVVVLDPKRIEFASLRGRPGIRVVSDPTAMQDELILLAARMGAWYDAREAGRHVAPVSTLLVVDELAQLVATVPDPKETRAALDQIARLARSARLHMIVATQQPNVAGTLSGDARENVSCAIATAPMTPQGSAMAAAGDSTAFRADTDGGVASDRPGRVGVRRHTAYDQVQAYWCEDPDVINEDLPATVARRMRDHARGVFPPKPAANGSEGADPINTI